MIDVKIKRLAETAKMPTRAFPTDAGLDLYAHLPDATVHEWGGNVINGIKIRPHETAMIGTGLAMAIPEGYWGGIFARSGLASKQGLRPSNCVGVVDCSYRNEVKVALYNDSNETRIVQDGDRVAQLIILPCPSVKLSEVDSLDNTARNMGGFGSSGTR